mmetsp:Transcript_19498/g.55754  ORF Transcript_19498/g.55754 Transcript_19498/m.55754 type:complete len:105 (+) Transcript_19498:30-344(+)
MALLRATLFLLPFNAVNLSERQELGLDLVLGRKMEDLEFVAHTAIADNVKLREATIQVLKKCAMDVEITVLFVSQQAWPEQRFSMAQHLLLQIPPTSQPSLSKR